MAMGLEAFRQGKTFTKSINKGGKNLRKGNKEIDSLIKSAGGKGALVASSENAFRNLLNRGEASSNLLGALGSVKALSSKKSIQ